MFGDLKMRVIRQLVHWRFNQNVSRGMAAATTHWSRSRERQCSLSPCVGVRFSTPVLAAGVLSILLASVAAAESSAEAIARIRDGPHGRMPPPQMAHATGGPGKGMTIENGTGHLLRVHFNGPTTQTVAVPNGQSAGLDLAVGTYEAAAEVPETPIMPFYGKQAYKQRTHYWLKFYVGAQTW